MKNYLDPIGIQTMPLKSAVTIRSNPVTGLEWPRGFQEIKVPKFHDIGRGWW
jgi:hypothetical protein